MLPHTSTHLFKPPQYQRLGFLTQLWTGTGLELLRDQRTKPLSERRITKSFRFSPETVALIQREAKLAKRTESAWIEDILSKAYSTPSIES